MNGLILLVICYVLFTGWEGHIGKSCSCGFAAEGAQGRGTLLNKAEE